MYRKYVYLSGVLLLALTSGALGQPPGLWNRDMTDRPEAPPLIFVPDFAHGRILMPWQMEPLEVMVTDRDGTGLSGIDILFVAPESGAGGSFANATPEGASFYRTQTNASGFASATFLANDIAGVYLVDAVIEGTEAAISFAMTNVTGPVSPALAADKARQLVTEQVLLNTIEDETLRLHGPVLLQAGTQVVSALLDRSRYPMIPITVDKLTWLFWIDEFPSAGFGHPTRFVMLDASQETPNLDRDAVIIRQNWWPEVTLLGASESTTLLPPSYTNRTVTIVPQIPNDVVGLYANEVAPTQGQGQGDIGAIIIYGPHEGFNKNGAEKMEEFFETILGIREENTTAGTNLLTMSIPSTPYMLGAFLRGARTKGFRRLYLYIACHGYTSNSGGGLVLANYDDSDGSTEEDYLSYEQLGKLLEPFKDTNTEVCIIINACHSGEAIQQVQNRGVNGWIITASDRASATTGPYFTLGGAAHFTDALLKCWKNSEADADGDGTVTGKEAFAWLKQHGGSKANSGKPQIATIDPAGGVYPISNVLIPKAGDTVAVTIRRPAGAVGNITVIVTITDPSVAQLTDPDNPDLPPWGKRRSFLLREGSASKVIHLTGLRDGETGYEASTIDLNEKKFRGTAKIQVGDGYNVRPTKVGMGETQKATLMRQGVLRQTPRPVRVDIMVENPSVANANPTTVVFPPGQSEVPFNLEGLHVSTTKLNVIDPLYDLGTSVEVIVTGSACGQPGTLVDDLRLYDHDPLPAPIPVGNDDCTLHSNGEQCEYPDPPEKICSVQALLLDMDQAAIDRVFGELFPPGEGPGGLTVYASPGPPPPGRYVLINGQLEGVIPRDDPLRSQQYAVVFDADGQTSNNYVPWPDFPNDWYAGTDLWYELIYTPDGGWEFWVTDPQDFADVQSNAWVTIADSPTGSEMGWFIPLGELYTDTPTFRVTAFAHTGDWGMFDPWSGDYWPLVGDPLLPVTGTLYSDDIRLYPPRYMPALLQPATDSSGNVIVEYSDLGPLMDDWLITTPDGATVK